ncbi:MAG TPA: peptide deformylase [Candidatus Saccharimonadia bacterium]|nr:peptide deformylase [Candidatus Saccharimonadia bacterium]
MTNSPLALQLVGPTDPLLNQVAQKVTRDEINADGIQAVIAGMLKLSAGKGHTKADSRQMVGLAAVQVGVDKRIISIDLAADGSNKQQDLLIVINPTIAIRSAATMPGREGCWSCGDICGNVERAKEVTLEGLDRHGKPLRLHLVDFAARIAQHETDHLDGIRFPDRIPKDHPERLHLVRPAEFEAYRQNWQNWPVVCPRETWESMKAGM